MKRLAIWTSVATIVLLNAIIILGLLGSVDARLYGRTMISVYAALLTTLHVVLPISSVLMLRLLVKDRHWTAAALFAAVVAGILVVVTLRLTGPALSWGVHLVTDLCALNIYLVVVPRYRSKLVRSGQPERA